MVLLVVLSFVFLMEMVNVVWILGPTTSPSIKLIIGLMVEILCHLRVGCLQYHFI